MAEYERGELRKWLRPLRRRDLVLGPWARPLARIAMIRRDRRPVPEAPGEVRGFASVRDSRRMIEYALAHYRAIGVTRFFITDNGSTDGTLEFLLAQPDVHVFESRIFFPEANFGAVFVQRMLDRFGNGHWCAVFDDDEHLVWPGMEEVPLAEFIAFHEARGAEAFAATMVDMYARGSIAEADPVAAGGPLGACPWFDPGPYRAHPEALPAQFPAHVVSGGPRARVFYGTDTRPGLSKAALVKWRPGLRRISTHYMSPVHGAETGAALLHFKLTHEFAPRAEAYVRWRSHYQNSQRVKIFAERMRAEPDISLWTPDSVRWRNSMQLVEQRLAALDPAYATELRARGLAVPDMAETG
jgi:hypothetical protein